MKRKILFVLMFLIFGGILVSAQSVDDEGNPNDPGDNDRANACYDGGSMEEKCDGIWEWTCGWYLIRFEAGIILRQDFPTQCSILLPPLAEGETVRGTPPMTVGCYDSASALDADLYFNGPINQANNIDVFNSTDGSCTNLYTGWPDVIEIYFEGTQANALLFCQSIHPAITYIENSLASGYSVPNAYYWLCH